MQKNRRPRLPLIKTDEVRATKKRQEIQEACIRRFLDRHNDKFSQQRKEFEIEFIRHSLRISQNAAEYIWRHYGSLALGSKGVDYSEEAFAEWAANAETTYFEIVQDLHAINRPTTRLITILAHLLPKNTREEWIGDLAESLEELRSQGVGRFGRYLLTLGRVCLLGVALVRITLADLISPGKKKRM